MNETHIYMCWEIWNIKIWY